MCVRKRGVYDISHEKFLAYGLLLTCKRILKLSLSFGLKAKISTWLGYGR